MATIIQPSYRWSGPFEGYIKGTPKNENGKSKPIFCKTLEEAKELAQKHPDIVGGITQIKENIFSLRCGNRLLCSPKKEKSWLFYGQ